MAKASKKSPEEKLRVVLSVLRGELSAAAAGRRAGVSEQTVHNWKKAFLEGGRDRLALGARRRSARELELEAECEELKAALWVRRTCSCGSGRRGRSFSLLRGPRDDPHRVPGAPCRGSPSWLGVPRCTYHARLARHRAGEVTKGPWPAPQLWTASSRRSPNSPPTGRRGGTARSGRWAATTAGTWRRRRACTAPWRAAACCNRCATRPNAANSPRRAGKCSWTRQRRRNRVWQVDFSAFETTD